MKLVPLTQFILHINAVVDSGKHTDISIAEVERHIETGDLVPWLQTRLAGDIDLSLYTDRGAGAHLATELNEGLRSILDAYRGQERRKWGIERSGLSLLIAWTNELIQQKSWSEE